MPVENLPVAGNPTMPAHAIPSQSGNAPAFVNNALLAEISAAVFDQVASRIETLTYAPEQIVFEEDDPGDSLYLIASGSIKISKRGRAGQQETLAYLMANDFFGEMALVDTGKRSAQAAAVGQTTLGRVDRKTWDLLLHLAPGAVMTNFMRSVTQRLRQNNQHFIEQMMRSERLSLLGTTVSSIVHDMNNPIGSILGACHIIQNKAGEPLICQMARIIRESVDSMESMTRELLDFSRGDTRLRLQMVSVPELVRHLEPDLDKCRATCEVIVDVGYDGAAQLDRQRMIRAFVNLIRNAREAMNPAKKNSLKFTVACTGETLHFVVRDTGPGIPAEILPKIFEPFMTHGKSNGTGLGLAVTKAVVEAHDGNISVQTGEAGTTFTISLPLKTEATQ